MCTVIKGPGGEIPAILDNVLRGRLKVVSQVVRLSISSVQLCPYKWRT